VPLRHFSCFLKRVWREKRYINLVGGNDARNLRSVLAELFVPHGEVLVRDLARRMVSDRKARGNVDRASFLAGDLAGDIKDQDARVCAVVVGRMHFVEPLLPCRVPNVLREATHKV
jgi:hypothetical protein